MNESLEHCTEWNVRGVESTYSDFIYEMDEKTHFVGSSRKRFQGGLGLGEGAELTAKAQDLFGQYKRSISSL